MLGETSVEAIASSSNNAFLRRPSTSDSSSSGKFETSSLSAAIFEAGDRAASAPPPPVPQLPLTTVSSIASSTSVLPTTSSLPPATNAPPPSSDITAITPNLYLTSLSGASNALSVAREKITHVLSLTATKPHLPPLPPPAVDPTHHHIPLADSPTAPLLDMLPEITTWIHNALNDARIKEPRVLVHCEFGMSRGPAAVIGYLMATRGLSFREGIRMVQEKRGSVCLNLGFVRALSKWAEVKGELWSEGAAITKAGTGKEKEKDDVVVDLPKLKPMTGVNEGGADAKRAKRLARNAEHQLSTAQEEEEQGDAENASAHNNSQRGASVVLMEKQQEREKIKTKKKSWRRLKCW